MTALRTRSAFDHPGLFVSGHLDAAYWDATEKVHPNALSGQGDLVVSKTFGSNDQFGALALVSYYQRASSTLNTYTLPYSYYPGRRLRRGGHADRPRPAPPAPRPPAPPSSPATTSAA